MIARAHYVLEFSENLQKIKVPLWLMGQFSKNFRSYIKTEKKFQNDNEDSPRFLHTTSIYEAANQTVKPTIGVYIIPFIIFILTSTPNFPVHREDFQ